RFGHLRESEGRHTSDGCGATFGSRPSTQAPDLGQRRSNDCVLLLVRDDCSALCTLRTAEGPPCCNRYGCRGSCGELTPVDLTARRDPWRGRCAQGALVCPCPGV